MNSSTRITLILLLTSLTTFIHSSKPSDKQLAQHYENTTNIYSQLAQTSFTFGTTTLWFEMLYKNLDQKNHVPESWKFARRINRPLLALSAVAFAGTAGGWFYNKCLAEHYKDKSKKWFWQR